eukprot:3877368-Pleurochrysis_carterae.AAC.1
MNTHDEFASGLVLFETDAGPSRIVKSTDEYLDLDADDVWIICKLFSLREFRIGGEHMKYIASTIARRIRDRLVTQNSVVRFLDDCPMWHMIISGNCDIE